MSLEVCRRFEALSRFKRLKSTERGSLRNLKRWEYEPDVVLREAHEAKIDSVTEKTIKDVPAPRELYPFPMIAKGVDLLKVRFLGK